MTVIVAATDGERWAMGCDGGAYNDGGTWQRRTPKIFSAHGTLVGCSGTGATPEVVVEADSGDPYSVAAYLRHNPAGGNWRVLMAGTRLWELDDSGQVNEFLGPFAAIGIGEQFCLGVAACLVREVGPDPETLVRYVLKMAAVHVTECRGEMTYMDGHA